MDGIYEEPTVALGFRDWADLAALDDGSFDVVTAVQLGRRLIDQAEDDCLTAEDYTTDDWADLRAVLGYTTLCWVAVAVVAALLILASGWTL